VESRLRIRLEGGLRGRCLTSRYPQALGSPYRTLKFNPTTRVWEVEADSCRYAVKLVDFQLRALEIASDLLDSSSLIRMMMQIPQRRRLRRSTLNLSKVKQDASPFQHELQAYERIRKHCLDTEVNRERERGGGGSGGPKLAPWDKVQSWPKFRRLERAGILK
jgi:hypothetical protein